MRWRLPLLASFLLPGLSLGAQQPAPAAPPALAAARVQWVCTGMCRGIPSGGPATIEPTRMACDSCLPLGLVLMAYGFKLQDQVTNNPEWSCWRL